MEMLAAAAATAGCVAGRRVVEVFEEHLCSCFVATTHGARGFQGATTWAHESWKERLYRVPYGRGRQRCKYVLDEKKKDGPPRATTSYPITGTFSQAQP